MVWGVVGEKGDCGEGWGNKVDLRTPPIELFSPMGELLRNLHIPTLPVANITQT